MKFVIKPYKNICVALDKKLLFYVFTILADKGASMLISLKNATFSVEAFGGKQLNGVTGNTLKNGHVKENQNG